MSTVKSLYHIVINTKKREMSIPESSKRALYAYIYGIIRNQGCTLSSSIWLKSHPESFPAFKGWGKEYYAFSVGVAQKDAVVAYIKNQETHHGTMAYDEEMQVITSENECDCYYYD